VRVNEQGDTPVERLARAMGEERVGEVGRTAARREWREQPRDEDAIERDAGRGGGAPERGSGVDRRTASDRGTGVTPAEAGRTLIERREHSKGDDNMPSPRPHPGLLDERSQDRAPRDVPKGRDDRSAPKGAVTRRQRERNPSIEARDDYRPRRPAAESGFESARASVDDDATTARKRTPGRANARRSSSAKRKLTRATRTTRTKANARQAPKRASRTAKRAAVARRPQVGKRKTGAAPRGDAMGRGSRGDVSARRRAKAGEANARPRRRGR
jgi:hypothetical protein